MMKPIIVRGAGDLATGTIYRLSKSGYSVIVLESQKPSAIRRQVSFCQAVYEGKMEVEGMICTKAESIEEALEMVMPGRPVLLVDEEAHCLKKYHPEILVDGILAKKNLGTKRKMADLTIALGPGFEAGNDVDYVIETKRGHYLGKIIKQGFAIPNTGVPGIIGGYGKERVIHAPCTGVFHQHHEIGDWVEAGQSIGWIETETGAVEVRTEISGVLRGIIQEGYEVTEHFKTADVDPRKESREYCALISDKARCIAGSVLELVSAFEKGMLKGNHKN